MLKIYTQAKVIIRNDRGYMDIDALIGAIVCIFCMILMLLLFAICFEPLQQEKDVTNGQYLMEYWATTYRPNQSLSDRETEQIEIRKVIKILTTHENLQTFKNIAIISIVVFFILIVLGTLFCFVLLKNKNHRKKKSHEKTTIKPEPIQAQEPQTSDVLLDLIKQLQIALDCQSLASQNTTLQELGVIIVKIRRKQRENPDDSMIITYSTTFAETATRLLRTYFAVDKEQNVSIENISKIKSEIIESFPVFLRYYRNVLNRMYEQQYYDVSSDVAVVKSLNNDFI